MRTIPLAIAIALAASTALAQGTAPSKPAPTPAAGSDMGFFKPRPDNNPSLTAPLPGERPASISPIPAAEAAPPPALPPEPASEVRPAEERTLRAESQMDRIEAENERARTAPVPPRVTGAFTGSTSERDR
jgi:hypothetical protein